LPAIQTIQTYLTHQTQAIQSHLTEILPSLIQGEVRNQCAQLAEKIGAQISSIREEVSRPTGDQDDPMSGEEGENEGSRGFGKRSARCSRDKGKGKEGRFATESDSEAAETRRHHRSQEPNNGDEADNEDDEEEMSAGSRKYEKKIQILRVSIYSCSL
jgi:hypothetical protein